MLRMEQLVNRYIKEKRKEDFALIYRLTFDDLYRFVLSKTNNREVTEEIVSDTYFLLLDLIFKYDSSKSKFSTFLFGIALNKLRQRWSKENSYISFSLDEDIEIEQESETYPEREKLSKKICNAFPSLSTKYMEVIQKRFFESKSIKDVAKELNMSITNVTTIQNRALNKLREIINEKV